MLTAYTNGIIFDGTTLHYGKALLLEGGKIGGLTDASAIPSGYAIRDLKGAYLSPAFIDVQIYGGNGKMFCDLPDTETLAATYDHCRKGGTGHLMITLATNSIELFLQGMDALEQYWSKGGKGILGLHLEGPYLHPAKKGAHLEQYIKQPTQSEVRLLLEKGKDVFKMMTLAPERCDPALVDLLQENGILLSAGHSNADYTTAKKAFDRGIPAATHLFNAMSPFQHRAPGLAGAILDHPTVKASVVCDGIHVDYAAVRIAKKVMQDRLFYITDAVTASLQGAYQHVFKGDHFALPDGTLSGSSLTMMQSVKNGVQHVGIPIDESLRMATSYPAALLNDARLGRLAKGADACLVVFNKEFEVLQFIEDGEAIVFQ
jgi:N-acetylglucosamine-6-phosphate deacetylase